MSNNKSNIIDINDLITMNELLKKYNGKQTTFERMKNQKSKSILSSSSFDNQSQYETLLDQQQIDRILSIINLDKFNLFLCYLIRYKNGDVELVPNKLLHKYYPQMVIDFLESNLKFSNFIPSDLNIEEDDNQNNEQQQQKNNEEQDQDQDDDYYLFDEISKYLSINDDFKIDEKIDKKHQKINFNELDDDNLNVESNNRQEDEEKLLMMKQGTSKDPLFNDNNERQEEINMEQPNKKNKIINNFIDDDELIKEFENDDFIYQDDDDDCNTKNIDIIDDDDEIQSIKDLNKINETLSMSNDDNNNDNDDDKDSIELSSISPDIIEQLLSKSKSKSTTNDK